MRAWSFAWLVCQAALLSAFVPRDCCAAHRSHAHKAPECHEPAKKTHCPMPAADGTACPMHQSAADGEDCRLRGMCDGPMAMLAHLMSAVALPVSPVTLTLAPPPAHALGYLAERAIDRAASPDAPPPRL